VNRQWARKYFAWLRPGPESKWISDLLKETPLLRNFNYDILKQGGPAMRAIFGYGVSGYEHAICDAIFERPENVLQDYPGHYVGGGSMPNLGIATIHLEARKTVFKNDDPDSKGWFYEMQEDGTVKEKGFLYKISWNFVNPHTMQEYKSMSDGERRDAGLQENGTVGCNIKITGKDADGKPISFYLYEKSIKANPGEPVGDTLSFYRKSELTDIVLEFEGGYKYDSRRRSDYPVKFQIQNLESNIPPDFEYFPTEAVEGATVSHTNPDGTAENIPADCGNVPKSLCNIS
jgi:hypothetical protein